MPNTYGGFNFPASFADAIASVVETFIRSVQALYPSQPSSRKRQTITIRLKVMDLGRFDDEDGAARL